MCPENGLWIPAFAGMTEEGVPGCAVRTFIPAFARMTALGLARHSREGGNPWFSDNRNPVLHPTLQRE